MKRILLTSAAMCIAFPAVAQEASTQEPSNAGDIVVTVQKRTETLSETPQTVNVVTGDQLEKYNLTNFEDVEKVVPGLQISRGDGRQQAVSLRGVTFDTDTGTNPTVDIYLNEVPLDPTQALNAQFDIGSIQVLRGPQGTLRGGTGPSGAILIGTRQPSLSLFEVNGSVSYTDFNSTNVQGGVSIPLVDDKLGIRLAGLYDRTEGAQIRNINNGEEDFSKSHGIRGTILYRPTPDLEFSLMHQQFRQESRGNFQVISTPGVPAGPYGRIDADDRAAVQLGPSEYETKGDITILNANWDFAGNRLSYVGSYQDIEFNTERDLNKGGAVEFFGPYYEYQNILIRQKIFSNELRFERTGDHFWLYRFGVYLNNTKIPFSGLIDYTGTLGTCNQPSGPGPYAIFGLPCQELGESPVARTRSRGYFTTQTFNFTENDTLDIGVRYSTSKSISSNPSKYDAWTGSVSYKHRFSDALLAYISAGTSFRPGGFDSQSAQQATLSDSIFEYDSEKSKSVEVGLKGELFDGQLFYSIAGYYQKFDNFINRVNNIACTGTPNPPGVSPTVPPDDCSGSRMTNLTYNAPASSRGIEFELRGNPLPDWNLGLNLVYADAHYDDASIPCNDFNGDGEPDSEGAPAVQRGQFFSMCESSGSLSATAKFQASLTSQVDFDIGDDFEGFVRGLARYQGKRVNANTNESISAGATVDAFVGVRTPVGAEFSFFVRNLTDRQIESFPQRMYSLFGTDTGYTAGSQSLGREFGMLLRFDY